MESQLYKELREESILNLMIRANETTVQSLVTNIHETPNLAFVKVS